MFLMHCDSCHHTNGNRKKNRIFAVGVVGGLMFLWNIISSSIKHLEERKIFQKGGKMRLNKNEPDRVFKSINTTNDAVLEDFELLFDIFQIALENKLLSGAFTNYYDAGYGAIYAFVSPKNKLEFERERKQLYVLIPKTVSFLGFEFLTGKYEKISIYENNRWIDNHLYHDELYTYKYQTLQFLKSLYIRVHEVLIKNGRINDSMNINKLVKNSTQFNPRFGN